MNSEHDNGKLLSVDAATFELEVLKSARPVLAAFATPWSRPCQIVASVLEEIAGSCSNRFKVVWINADENPDLGLWYGIQAVPTLLYFNAGKVRGKVVGTASTTAILSKLETIIDAPDNAGGSANV